MKSNSFEVYRDPKLGAIFYFSQCDENLTTGVLFLPPHTELTKHNRPLAFENLIQISGKCVMKVFDDNDRVTEYPLSVGDTLRMDRGQWHIHANPHDEASLTIFKIEGDITAIVQAIRESCEKL
ncbi:cupin domain-containing protein [Candidatus Saccharibacteria bacterium]|nr:cupin domain-containing protein [Candidatus Saccharibacteria bacterium]